MADIGYGCTNELAVWTCDSTDVGAQVFVVDIIDSEYSGITARLAVGQLGLSACEATRSTRHARVVVDLFVKSCQTVLHTCAILQKHPLSKLC